MKLSFIGDRGDKTCMLIRNQSVEYQIHFEESHSSINSNVVLIAINEQGLGSPLISYGADR
jgi:hypothetical protein